MFLLTDVSSEMFRSQALPPSVSRLIPTSLPRAPVSVLTTYEYWMCQGTPDKAVNPGTKNEPVGAY